MELWEQQPDEPARWYARFDVYRLSGPGRSIEETFRLVSNIQSLAGKRPGQAWHKAAKQWRWAERAAAWDAHQRQQLMEQEADRRFDAREHRLSIIERLLRTAVGVIDTAQPQDLSLEEARDLLPTMRLFIRDLLAAHRAELPAILADLDDSSGDGIPPFTADELIEATKQMQRPHTRSLYPHRTLAYLNLRNSLAELYPDPASARRIAHTAGLNLAAIPFTSAGVDTWHAILVEAERTAQTDELIAVALTEYSTNAQLRRAIHDYRSNA